MKTSNILKASLLMGVVVAASSCTEEKIYGIDPNGIPQASDYAIKVDVDQTTNQFTLTMTDANGNPAKGAYPVWKIYTKNNPVTSTRPVYTDIVTVAGDYDVEMQVGNHNGLSDGVKTGTIHIENTLVNFSSYIKNLTDNESKVWQIAANEQGHLGCGDTGTEGLNYWSAPPYDKKDWGVYDNRMIFTDTGSTNGGNYTYDPGESGTIYVNTGITDLPPYSDYNTNDGIDYCAPAELQNTTFTLVPEGNDLYIVFPAGTLLGYLPNVEVYNNPKFKVYSVTAKKIELSIDNGEITWHYILQPEGADAGDRPFEGFKYDSEFNLWKDADVHLNSTWFADSGWGELGNQPEVEVTNESIKLHTPAEMGGDKWQGQVHIGTDIILSSASTYDFSIKVTSNVDSKVTIKPHLDGDDNTFFTEDQVAFDAGGSYFYLSDVPGWDGPVVLTLDFAGYPDTDFEISKVVIKDHANDDGTILPNENGGNDDEGDSFGGFNPDSEVNQWNSAAVTLQSTWFANNDWAELDPQPDVEVSNAGIFLHTPADMGGSQWQGQVHVGTDITVAADQFYDFSCRVNVAGDGKVTVKVQKDGDDNTLFPGMGDQKEVKEGDNIIYFINQPGFDGTLKIAFDFGGLPDQDIKVTDIVFKNHADNDGTDTPVSWNDEDNLWKGYDVGSIYYATGGDWAGLPDYDYERTDYGYHLFLPTETMSQWQAQMHIPTDIYTSSDNKYDFCITFKCSNDVPSITVKLHPEGDDGTMYMEDKVACAADEPVTYALTNMNGIDADVPWVLTLDFGGNPAETDVEVSNIHFQIHK